MDLERWIHRDSFIGIWIWRDGFIEKKTWIPTFISKCDINNLVWNLILTYQSMMTIIMMTLFSKKKQESKGR